MRDVLGVVDELFLASVTTVRAKRIGAAASRRTWAMRARQGDLAGVTRARQRQSSECMHTLCMCAPATAHVQYVHHRPRYASVICLLDVCRAVLNSCKVS